MVTPRTVQTNSCDEGICGHLVTQQKTYNHAGWSTTWGTRS
jgi:hypothetical protein